MQSNADMGLAYSVMPDGKKFICIAYLDEVLILTST